MDDNEGETLRDDGLVNGHDERACAGIPAIAFRTYGDSNLRFWRQARLGEQARREDCAMVQSRKGVWHFAAIKRWSLYRVDGDLVLAYLVLYLLSGRAQTYTPNAR